VNFYECEVIKKLDNTNKKRFENYGFYIHKKDGFNDHVNYKCLLSNSDILELKNLDIFKIVKENKNPFQGDIYSIHCDGSVHNYGNEKKSIKLSALSVIIFKNDKEIFRTVKVYEQFLDNNTVEILALLVAIRYLIKNDDKITLKQSKILVNSDSQNLQEYIIRPKIIQVVVKKCKSESSSLYYSETMRELLNELNFYLSFLNIYSGWIKGHTQIKITSNKSTLLNNTCDKMCKVALKEKLHKLKLDSLKENITKKGNN